MSFRQYLDDTIVSDPRFQELLVFFVLGLSLVLYALKMSIDAFRPMPGMPIDGRGLLTSFIVPPVAAIGGVLLGHTVARISSYSNQSLLVRIPLYLGFAVLGIIPSLGYVLFFSGWDVSKELSTYRVWFVIALLVGVLAWIVSELRR